MNSKLLANKTGQLQMGETIFVIIIVIILLVFGIIFYAQAQTDEFKKEEREAEELDTIALSQVTSSLTEIQCSMQGVKSLSCFDKNKLEAFSIVREKNPMLTEEYYFSQLTNSKIQVRQIYPPMDDAKWVVYENTYHVNETFTTKPVIVPVLLYDPVLRKNSFGILEIYKYSRVSI